MKNLTDANRQRGMTLVELGIVLLVISLVVLGIYAKATSINQEANVQRAVDDSILLLTKAALYRSETGSYADLADIVTLNTQGYVTDPINTGTAQNPWGLDYDLEAVDDNDNQVQLTITTDRNETCTRMMNVMNGLVNNQVAENGVTCDEAVLTILAR